MVEYEALVQHVTGQAEIEALDQLNELRKSLIKLAIFKLLSFENSQNNESLDEQIAQMKSQINDYEIYINKLKQENSSKMIILNGKIKSQQEEILKLNKQLKELDQDGVGGFKPRIKLSKSNISFKPNNYLSPTFGSRRRSIYADDDKSILTPIISRTKTTIASLKRLDENSDTKRRTRSKKVDDDDDDNNEDISSLSTSKSKLTSSPYKTPSKTTFIENFDKDDDSDSDSQAFTPTRTGSNTSITLIPRPKIKRKKLKLRKSSKSNNQTSPRSLKKMGIDNEDMDPATYYSDANFLNQEDNSPQKKRKITISNPLKNDNEASLQ